MSNQMTTVHNWNSVFKTSKLWSNLTSEMQVDVNSVDKRKFLNVYNVLFWPTLFTF